MTIDPKALGAAAARVRAVIYYPQSLAGERQPEAPLERGERLRGGEFVAWDARRDAVLLLTPLLDLTLTDPVRRAVERAIASPTLRRLRHVEAALRYGLPEDAISACLRVADLLPFHRAALGCPVASAECSAAALDAAALRVEAGDFGHAFLSFRASLLWASDAATDATQVEYVPEPLYGRLAAHDQQSAAWLRAFTVIDAAERMVADEDAILRGGAGVPAEDVVPLDDIMELAKAAASPARKAPAPGRTLVVVPSLAHLPKPSTSAADRRDTPRAEFEAVAGRALPLRPAPDPHRFVEEASARAPWLRPVFEIIAQDLVGAPYAWLRPTLLVAGPGAGKTAAATRIAAGLGLPFRVYGVTATADGTFAGTSRQWSSGRASIPAQTVRQEECASIAIVIDEIEKGTPDRRNGRLDEAILPFLERESSRRVFDPYLECAVDLSAVTYLATANDLSGVPGPLRDRLRIIRVPLPRAEDLPIVAANVVADIRAERGIDAAWLPDLDGEELALLGQHWRGGSLRPLRRLVETVVAGRDRLAPRH